MRSTINNKRKGLIIPFGALLLWYLLGMLGKLNTQLFPTPVEVFQALSYLIKGGSLWGHILQSLLRVFWGFSLAVCVGVPLGLLLGCLPQSNLWFGPSLNFLRQIPPIAWVPVFLLWFGIGEAPKYAVIFYAAVFPIVINSALGVQQIPKDYWEVARSLCLSPQKTLRTLVIPGSRQAVFTGLRLGMGLSWRAIVAAEMIASTSGLGYLVMSARSLVRIDEMFAGIILIGLIGMLIDLAFLKLQEQLAPSWRRVPEKVGGEGCVHTTTPVTASF